MGQALLARWQELKLYQDIYVIEPAAIDADVPHVQQLGDLPPAYQPDIIIFAVKPQILPDVIWQYKTYTDKGALVLSIAAGKSIGFFTDALGNNAAVVRAMPNTPAAIGHGMTVAAANDAVTDAQKNHSEKLLSAVGKFLWAEDEQWLDPVTAVSGSGPAYIFLLIEAMAKAGAKLGLPDDMAMTLARQTVIGAAALAGDSADIPASTLRENVTSPGGTTAAALAVLMRDQNGMQDLFDEALKAAATRAEELSK